MRTDTAPIIEPHVVIETVTTPAQAHAALCDFALANGYSLEDFEAAMELIYEVVSRAPEVITIWCHWDDKAKPAHDVFEAIVASPIAHGLAIIATDAHPGARISTAELPDACGASAQLN